MHVCGVIVVILRDCVVIKTKILLLMFLCPWLNTRGCWDFVNKNQQLKYLRQKIFENYYFNVGINLFYTHRIL